MPLTIEECFVGMRVRLLDIQYNQESRICRPHIGEHVTVTHVDRTTIHIDLLPDNAFFPKRFEVVQLPVAPDIPARKFRVGDRLQTPRNYWVVLENLPDNRIRVRSLGPRGEQPQVFIREAGYETDAAEGQFELAEVVRPADEGHLNHALEQRDIAIINKQPFVEDEMKHKVGDVVWYKDHEYIIEQDRPKYYVVAILEDGKVRISYDQDVDNAFGSYSPDMWIAVGKQAKAVKPKAEPKVTKEMFDAEMEKIKKLLPKSHGVSNFWVISDEKGRINVSGGLGQICHAGLRYNNRGGKLLAVVDSISNRVNKLPEHKKQGFKDYANYLMNRSPWAGCYKTSKFEDADANGIQMNLDATANQLVGACIAMRQASEKNEVLPVFNFLKSKRFSGDVCFLVSYFYSHDGNGNFYPIHVTSPHSILSSSMNAENVFKFFATQEFVGEEDKQASKDSLSYSNIYGSIDEDMSRYDHCPNAKNLGKWMEKNCPKEQLGEGLAKRLVVTEESILKLARLVKAELLKYKQEVAV